jgi:hypothetical protein
VTTEAVSASSQEEGAPNGMNTTAQQGAQQQQAKAAGTQTTAADRKDMFTLIFPGHLLAVLEVRGASSQDEARTVACEALPQCSYEVVDGDQTAGQAEIFYSWCSAEAQERQPHHQPRQMQQATTARSQEEQEEAQA